MRLFAISLTVAVALATLTAQAWQADNGDGTYTNPPLYADYPDPDIIRVGEDFYFATTTTFANAPGLRILHARDLVNWDIAAHVLPRLDGRKAYDLDGATAYRAGVYAPSLRWQRGSYYYLFNAVPRRLAMSISRARRLQGPWQTVDSIDSPRTGGHQGALVELADGRWWGFVMQDRGAIGRVTNLSPVFWQEDWPVWGTPEAPGRVPAVARKPVQGQPKRQPATSDEFDTPALGLQWAWNHNPDDTHWSLKERPGFLRLHATRAHGFWTARNTLTQKGQGLYSHADVKLDLQGPAPPGRRLRAGLRLAHRHLPGAAVRPLLLQPRSSVGQQGGHVDVDWFRFSDQRDPATTTRPAAKEPTGP